jgi:hypothetical protein
MMRRMRLGVVLGLLAVLALSRPVAAADQLSAADQIGIRTTIERQLAAFQRDGGAAAFAFAAPTIKAKFGTPANFMAMVRAGYAPVYRPREVDFQGVTEIAGAPTQEVLVVGPDGLTYLAFYVMGQQPDGRWLIEGCILHKLTDVSA